MKNLRIGFIWIATIVVSIYLMICIGLYFCQERLIFHPLELDKDYTFSFENKWNEVFIDLTDGKKLHGLLFKSDSSKGLIFYLHGNAGNLASWGEAASAYTDLGYDVFMLDYRGYGKSEGTIESQEQLFHDVQIAYDSLKTKYYESDIVILGYSIGTGIASSIAARNTPRILILQAPFYSMSDMMEKQFSFIPKFLLRYEFPNNEFLKKCTIPVVIFHGRDDEIIPYESSERLLKETQTIDSLIALPFQGHNGMTDNPDYRIGVAEILKKYEGKSGQ